VHSPGKAIGTTDPLQPSCKNVGQHTLLIQIKVVDQWRVRRDRDFLM
jgi:hypothetical protein